MKRWRHRPVVHQAYKAPPNGKMQRWLGDSEGVFGIPGLMTRPSKWTQDATKNCRNMKSERNATTTTSSATKSVKCGKTISTLRITSICLCRKQRSSTSFSTSIWSENRFSHWHGAGRFELAQCSRTRFVWKGGRSNVFGVPQIIYSWCQHTAVWSSNKIHTNNNMSNDQWPSGSSNQILQTACKRKSALLETKTHSQSVSFCCSRKSLSTRHQHGMDIITGQPSSVSNTEVYQTRLLYSSNLKFTSPWHFQTEQEPKEQKSLSLAHAANLFQCFLVPKVCYSNSESFPTDATIQCIDAL